MDTPIYMQWYPGDYLAATGHLSTVEHGAYCLLLMAYWVNNGPLKDDNGRLARTVRMSLQEWLEIRDTVAEFFIIGDGQWRHYRLDDDLQSFYARLEQTRNAGRKSALKRWGNEKVTDVTTDAITVVTNPLQRKSNASSSSSTPSSSSSSNISLTPSNPPCQGEVLSLFGNEFANDKTEVKPEPKSKKKTNPHQAIIDEWNLALGGNTRLNKDALREIKARLDEGYSEQDIIDCVKGYAKDDWWMANSPIPFKMIRAKNIEQGMRLHRDPNALAERNSNRQSSQPKQNMYGMGMITDMSKIPDEDCITPYDVDYEVQRRV